MKIFFFKSSRKSDKLSVLTICTSTIARATAIAQLNFLKNKYKGKPQLVIL